MNASIRPAMRKIGRHPAIILTASSPRSISASPLVLSPGTIIAIPSINPAPPEMKIAVNSKTRCPIIKAQSCPTIPYFRIKELIDPNINAVGIITFIVPIIGNILMENVSSPILVLLRIIAAAPFGASALSVSHHGWRILICCTSSGLRYEKSAKSSFSIVATNENMASATKISRIAIV